MRLDHVVIPVFDAAGSLRFYNETLGLPLVAAHEGDDWDGYPWLMMIFGLEHGRELVLVALRGADPEPTRLPADARHYALAEESIGRLQGWRERLAAAGVDFWEEDHGDQQSLYFADPNGVTLEITAPPSIASPAGPGALAAARRWIAAA